MIYILFNSCCYPNLNLQVCCSTRSFNCFEYQDYVLVLQKPKLITGLNDYFTSSSATTSKYTLDNASPKSSLNNKFDKKYKSSSQEEDIIDSRKAKNKLAKNRRKKSQEISSVKIFSSTSEHLFSQESLDQSNLKSRKGKKRIKTTSNSENISQNKLGYDINQESRSTLNFDKNIIIDRPLTVQELSLKINIPEAEIITYLFLNRGISVTINQLLDIDVVSKISTNYGFTLVKNSMGTYLPDKLPTPTTTINSVQRAPIITILGHVDHGKTTLLDSILKTQLVDKEIGGITQAISGYDIVFTDNFKKYSLVFLDTPGHESFKAMRLRGAKVTDIVLLVVALDDGIKPQTIEAIQYINDMQLSCIIVITKADKMLDNVQKIKQDLASNQLICKDLGGNIELIEVSATTGKNINELLSLICMLSNNKKLLANPQTLAFGTILESYLDKKQGPVANIIIKDGTIKVGNIIASDNLYGKVKSIISSSKKRIDCSGPSSVVQILGFTEVPLAGSVFRICQNEKQAQQYCSEYSGNQNFNTLIKSLNTRITSESNLNIKQLQLVIKTDTQGSLEAILDLLLSISQSKVQINIMNSTSSFGIVSASDVELALASDAYILAFNVPITSDIKGLLKKSRLSFKTFNIIYELFEYVQNLMLSLVDNEYKYVLIGTATVKTVFKMNQGFVAGCLIETGRLNKESYIHVNRNGSLVYQGFINSLKQMKNDATEVLASDECGLMTNFEAWQQLDKIEAYEVIVKEKTL